MRGVCERNVRYAGEQRVKYVCKRTPLPAGTERERTIACVCDITHTHTHHTYAPRCKLRLSAPDTLIPILLPLPPASNETNLVTRANASVFAQMFGQLHMTPPAQLRRKDGRAWFAKFVGEPAIDDGGLFRESYSAMSEELQSGVLPLFVETANGFVPNPAALVLLDREHRRRSSGGGGGVPAHLSSSMEGSVVKEWYR